MKPEEMDRKIAEFMGKTVVRSASGGYYTILTKTEHFPNGYEDGSFIFEEGGWARLPKYSTDLNAIRSAEQLLFTRYHDAKAIFIDRLLRIMDPVSGYRKQGIDIIDATAEQHALAFVQTIGQFKP